jgi:hypothetical protein
VGRRRFGRRRRRKGKRKRLNPTIQREEILWSHYQIKREEKESDLKRKIFVYSSILIGLH